LDAKIKGPITKTRTKLINYKNTAQLALSLLQNEEGVPLDSIISLCNPNNNYPACKGEEEFVQRQAQQKN
jgi:hypothetical protein